MSATNNVNTNANLTMKTKFIFFILYKFIYIYYLTIKWIQIHCQPNVVLFLESESAYH